MYLTMNLVRLQQSRFVAAVSTSSSSALCFNKNAFSANRVSSSVGIQRRHDKQQYGTNRFYSSSCLSKDTPHRIKQYVAFVRKTYNVEPHLVSISSSSSATAVSVSSSRTDKNKNDDDSNHLKRKTMRKKAATVSATSSSMLTASKHSIVEQHQHEHYDDDPSTVNNNKTEETTAAKEVIPSFTTINYFPTALQPYLRLIRIDKPIGTWLLYWPCAWSVGLATSPGCLPDPYMLALFGAGAFILRSAGCVINDMWDKDIDAKVKRTKNRPIASGQITRLDAFMFLAGILALGDLVLIQFNTQCIVLGSSALALIAIYPLMKRITNWPQLFLGLVMNYGALMGWTAIHGSFDYSICLPLYAGCISWTLIYDTIYAHQDKKDDAKVGVKSTALHMGDNTKHYLMGFTATLVSGFVGAGIMSDQTFPYYIGLGLATSHILHQIITLDMNNADECGKKFNSNYILGFVIMAGIIASTLLKGKKENSTKQINGNVEIGQSVTL